MKYYLYIFTITTACRHTILRRPIVLMSSRQPTRALPHQARQNARSHFLCYYCDGVLVGVALFHEMRVKVSRGRRPRLREVQPRGSRRDHDASAKIVEKPELITDELLRAAAQGSRIFLITFLHAFRCRIVRGILLPLGCCGGIRWGAGITEYDKY